MGIDGKIEKHESYGLAMLTRRSGGSTNLFGSSINHHSTMMLSIEHAEKTRDLSRDWYFGYQTIVEIELSPVQFAEMVTGVGIGPGIPCTIRWLDGKRMENPPEVKQRQLFEEEFKERMETVTKTVYGDVEEAFELLRKKGTINVSERKKVANIIGRIVEHIKGSLPFVQSSFNEAMDKTVMEAKGEVEAFVMNKVTTLGIEKLRGQLPEITEKQTGEVEG